MALPTAVVALEVVAAGFFRTVACHVALVTTGEAPRPLATVWCASPRLPPRRPRQLERHLGVPDARPVDLVDAVHGVIALVEVNEAESPEDFDGPHFAVLADDLGDLFLRVAAEPCYVNLSPFVGHAGLDLKTQSILKHLLV